MPSHRWMLLLGAITSHAHAANLIPWQEAHRQAGRLVRVEGFVESAERVDNRVTLRFDADDPAALTITLVIPLLNDLPSAPETIYRERRVRVLGRITRVGGRLDMIVTDPDRIEIVGLTPPDAEPPSAPAATAPPPVSVPASTPSSSPPPPTAPALRDGVRRDVDACQRYAASRDTLRADALAATEALRSCLAGTTPRCTIAADAIAAPVARLERLERTIREHCPSD